MLIEVINVLGYRVKELRNKKSINQTKFAQLLGVSRSAVSMWEIDKSEPDNEMLIKISQVLNCSTDYLLGKTETIKTPLQMQESLTADEQKLLNYFRELNDEGQYILLNQAQALATSGLYIKNKEPGIHSENPA